MPCLFFTLQEQRRSLNQETFFGVCDFIAQIRGPTLVSTEESANTVAGRVSLKYS
jgi:hypothetical protein